MAGDRHPGVTVSPVAMWRAWCGDNPPESLIAEASAIFSVEAVSRVVIELGAAGLADAYRERDNLMGLLNARRQAAELLAADGAS